MPIRVTIRSRLKLRKSTWTQRPVRSNSRTSFPYIPPATSSILLCTEGNRRRTRLRIRVCIDRATHLRRRKSCNSQLRRIQDSEYSRYSLGRNRRSDNRGYGAGPYNSVSIGEAANLPVAAAIANAVEDAVGVRIIDLPITCGKSLRRVKRPSLNRDPQGRTGSMQCAISFYIP